jgi:hypothetical protein
LNRYEPALHSRAISGYIRWSDGFVASSQVFLIRQTAMIGIEIHYDVLPGDRPKQSAPHPKTRGCGWSSASLSRRLRRPSLFRVAAPASSTAEFGIPCPHTGTRSCVTLSLRGWDPCTLRESNQLTRAARTSAHASCELRTPKRSATSIRSARVGGQFADSGPCGQVIPVDVGTENALMWAAIPS